MQSIKKSLIIRKKRLNVFILIFIFIIINLLFALAEKIEYEPEINNRELVKNFDNNQEKNFSNGILAINVNKSIYLENEDAFIDISLLDNKGQTVCDANLTLTVINPNNEKTVFKTNNKDNNSISNNNDSNNKLNNNIIKVSPECGVLGVTDLPDYYTEYSVNGLGTYVMNLTAVANNGVRNIVDSFVVQDKVEFDVARDGPTRIYPLVPYNMNFTINVNKDYNGIINEYVPASFAIRPQQGLAITTVDDTKILSWNKNLINGETYNLDYEFDAPDISPEFYLLGPLEIGIFKEARNWQIASDATEGVAEQLATGSDTETEIKSDQEIGQEFVHDSDPDPDFDVTNISVYMRRDSDASDQAIDVELRTAWSSGLLGTATIASTDASLGTSLGFVNATFSTAVTLTDDITYIIRVLTDSSNGKIWYGYDTGNSYSGGRRLDKDGNPQSGEDLLFIVWKDTTVVADTTKPRINASIYNVSAGQSAPRINDVVNFTANVSDETGLDTCVFYMNGTSDGHVVILNKSFDPSSPPTNGQCSQEFTIDLIRGNVINFTVIINDTSTDTAGGNINHSVNRSDAGAEVIGQIIVVENTPVLNRSIVSPLDGKITNEQPLYLNVTYLADPDGDVINITYYINGKINQTQIEINTTFNASDGTYILNVSMHDNVSPITYSANISVNFTIDTTVPVVNTTLNKTSIVFGDIINITANVTDGVDLSFCQIIINQSGADAIEFINISLAGKTGHNCFWWECY